MTLRDYLEDLTLSAWVGGHKAILKKLPEEKLETPIIKPEEAELLKKLGKQLFAIMREAFKRTPYTKAKIGDITRVIINDLDYPWEEIKEDNQEIFYLDTPTKRIVITPEDEEMLDISIGSQVLEKWKEELSNLNDLLNSIRMEAIIDTIMEEFPLTKEEKRKVKAIKEIMKRIQQGVIYRVARLIGRKNLTIIPKLAVEEAKIYNTMTSDDEIAKMLIKTIGKEMEKEWMKAMMDDWLKELEKGEGAEEKE